MIYPENCQQGKFIKLLLYKQNKTFDRKVIACADFMLLIHAVVIPKNTLWAFFSNFWSKTSSHLFENSKHIS